MISFLNDYSECVHPLILKMLAENCYEQNEGYGQDRHSKAASDFIRSYIGNVDVDIHFLNGGTQANLTVLSAMLRPFDAVIATERSHINTHETGAIEGCGHKVLAMPGEDGKLTPEDILEAVHTNTTVHMVHPAAVYISDTTEIGSVYTKQELTGIREICNEYGLFLFLDGARLGSALTSEANDLTLRDLAWLTDVFTIGGTKNGALSGEAVVISNSLLQKDFRYYMKHKGAMNAKGFILGMQFEALFRDRLYFQLAEHANEMAGIIKDACVAAGFPFLSRPVSNQIFPVVDNETVQRLQKEFAFEIWEPADDSHQIIRFVTSWATRKEQVQKLADAIRNNK